MGTIVGRPRKDGTVGYTAQVKIKREGRIVFSKAQTFDREAAAKAWIKRKELELSKPGALEEASKPKGTLADMIDRYLKLSRKEIGKTKAQVLEAGRVLVRDMKNPGEKAGNDVWCALVPEAEAIAAAMPRVADQIFPFDGRTISAAFTRACKLLEIEDLHFHDLRHEGASRLFEMGNSIPRVAEVAGHRSWQSLQRYSHLRQTGDKMAGWKWLPAVTTP